MRRSHPTAFVVKKRDSCAVCTNIPPCPSCPKGQQCQQIFRSSCQDCPVNRCIPIPGYDAGGGTNKSALGGGVAALLIVAAAAVAYWFWRRLKAKRRRIALHEDAVERREKVRNEKEATTLQLGGAKAGSDNTSPFAIVDEDELDGDTEYTQVTGGLNDGDALGSLAEPTAFRRRSFGAATHLSRITEGVEEDEEEAVANKRNTIGSLRSGTMSFAGTAPRISVGSSASLGSANIIPIAFRPPSPASAGQSSNDDGYQSISPLALPTTAHRATGAPAIQVNTARNGPIRPTRAPDLNLRLPEAPHKPSTSSPLASATPAYEFMSIDPVEALKTSGPYSRPDRPLSSATVNTINSTHSGSLSYVMSAPQVITPVSGEGVRRVQLGNGGKAQLVKVPSLKRKEVKEDPFKDPVEPTTSATAPVGTAEVGEDEDLLPPSKTRFASANGRDSTMSTSTLGIPFGENPFGPFAGAPTDQTSPSDAEERSSWLASRDAPQERGTDPFQDPERASVGGVSLGQFPFDLGDNR
ncbi:hypothetical protein PSEUBRA_003701 [Kalmanozyma brasiliensis GHG001]|uniref:Membrane anchor Opy2 N-terminal domain-containing protein n=1 Tax=Kalmanozyma brasiliensis (strain GHG001) TaxID=1365824 RepID=V5GLR3_KALBG|nr:uncharacterized protein PSEUBRA_003701 [Kalmanozyma brasiliensis GHG001]EST06907.1 hypothetical protein PSEUBRA_003701 [Kalmanozyma brasiliensis GHG001]